MYVRRNIRLRHLFFDSWLFLIVATAWSSLIYYLNVFAGHELLAIPMTPVTTIGVAVSLYLGFKSTSAYNRWWEARKIWGDILNRSRDWGASVFNLVYYQGGAGDREVQRELIHRHLAWVNALAYQLRQNSRLKMTRNTRIFGHRRIFDDTEHHQTPASYQRLIPPSENASLIPYANPATHLLRKQADQLRELAAQGYLDSYRHVAMMNMIGAFYDAQGKCERIKKTPFPRQVANFGLLFTWVFIVLLPLAFVDVFREETASHMASELAEQSFLLVMVPFTVLISWVFFIMEKVSDSTEDPFEGGATDVPISAIARTIEIDLKQMLEAENKTAPLAPVDGVLY